MDLSLWSIKTNNWSADNFKKNTPPQWIVHLSMRYSQVTLVSWCPLWQLLTDHNMDIRYQVKQIVYALDTLPVIPGHYKKTANQSACTIVAIE